ncbi:MAG: TAXI family TRAP transporter solute-binding subunit, partial [bacterium]
AILAASGMRAPEFKGVRVSPRYPALNRFLLGRLDAMVFAMGGPLAAKADARVRGIRALPIPYNAMALVSMQEVRPAFYISMVMPGPRNRGVERPMPMLTTDMVLVVNREVSRGMVQKLIGVIAENKPALVKGHFRFNDFFPQWMAKPFPGVEFHPAALQYYRGKNRLKKKPG